MLRATAADLAVVPRMSAPAFSRPVFAREGGAGATKASPVKTLSHPLALRVPPLVIALLAGVGAWLGARAFPALQIESAALLPAAVTLGALGAACSLLGVVSFRRAHTTMNPLRPGVATTLVVSGVYRFTRNPMYLGFLCLLLAELAWLGSPVALLAAPALIAYLNRFQITVEERALSERFGAQFATYTNRVPRWL